MREDGSLVAALTLKAESAKQARDLERIERLAGGVRRALYNLLLTEWRTTQDENQVVLAIEHPVLNSGNVDNYRKQASTLHAFEAKLFEHRIMQWLIEVNPTAAKKMIVGHGGATKPEVIAKSPFKGSGHTIETMADAWMIAEVGRRMWLVKATHQLAGSFPQDVRDMIDDPYPIHAMERP